MASQTAERSDDHRPLAEQAKAEFRSGPRMLAASQRRRACASPPSPRLTCTDAVDRIIARPSGQAESKYVSIAW